MSSSPTYRFQRLLDLGVQGASLEGDDLRGSIGVVGDRGSALAAEDSVHGVAAGALGRVGLGGAVDGQRGLGDDGHQSCSKGISHWSRGGIPEKHTVGRAALALAVIAVVVAVFISASAKLPERKRGEDQRSDQGLIDGSAVGDSAAKTVTGERHSKCDSRKVLKSAGDLETGQGGI